MVEGLYITRYLAESVTLSDQENYMQSSRERRRKRKRAEGMNVY